MQTHFHFNQEIPSIKILKVFVSYFNVIEKLQELHFKIAIINKGNNFLDCQIQIYALLLCKDLIPFMND